MQLCRPCDRFISCVTDFATLRYINGLRFPAPAPRAAAIFFLQAGQRCRFVNIHRLAPLVTDEKKLLKGATWRFLRLALLRFLSGYL